MKDRLEGQVVNQLWWKCAVCMGMGVTVTSETFSAGVCVICKGKLWLFTISDSHRRTLKIY